MQYVAIVFSTLLTSALSKKALFAVGTTTLVSDTWFKTELESAGYTVTLVDDDTIKESTYTVPTDYDFVVVSASVSSGKVGGKFKDVTSDFMSWEEGVYDDMGMTAANPSGSQTQVNNGAASSYWKKAKPTNDFAYPDSLTDISMVAANSNCALAAGQSGTVSVFSQAYGMSWGVAGSAAKSIATITTPSHSSSAKSVIFSYKSGDTLADGTTAKGKRVACFPYHFGNGNTINTTIDARDPSDGTVPLTTAGKALVKACIAMDLSCGTATTTPATSLTSNTMPCQPLLPLLVTLMFALISSFRG